MSYQQLEQLSLYHYQSCPFCGITREAIKYIELPGQLAIQQHDIIKQPKFRKELIEGGGKPQVPCLKIEELNGTTRWLYESSDIIKYLKKTASAITDLSASEEIA